MKGSCDVPAYLILVPGLVPYGLKSPASLLHSCPPVPRLSPRVHKPFTPTDVMFHPSVFSSFHSDEKSPNPNFHQAPTVGLAWDTPASRVPYPDRPLPRLA